MIAAPLLRRVAASLASVGISALMLGSVIAPAPAAANDTAHQRATLAAPVERERHIVRGTVWFCEGTRCVAARSGSRPAVNCARLAAKVGTITRFVSGNDALDAEALARCNAD